MTQTGADQRRLRQALAVEADHMPAARVPEDLWRRGRRRYRQQVASVLTVVLTVALTLPMVGVLLRSPSQVGAATDAGAVPGEVYDPWPWQAPVAQSPPGRAAVLFGGSGAGIGGIDWPWTYGTKMAVVGRDGAYRMLRYSNMYMQAGQDVQISPDGRYVAGPDSLDDLTGLRSSDARLSVVDLVTGHIRHYAKDASDTPIGWQPDGKALLLWRQPAPPPGQEDVDSPAFDGHEAAYNYVGGSLWLLDLSTGHSRHLLDLDGIVFDPTNSVAFAPDGHLAVQLDRTLVLLDTTHGSRRTLATLAAGQRLAGTGAFTADGSRIAVLELHGCAVECSEIARDQRSWQLDVLDAGTGAVVPGTGFDSMPGAAVRVAGWERDGTAVVVTYRDESDAPQDNRPAQEPPTAYRAVDRAELLALRPGGGTSRPVRVASGVEVWDIDVAADLLREGRFGGTAPRPTPFPAAVWLYGYPLTAACLILLLVCLGSIWRRWTRRRRY
jgi:hypothetical protein